MKMVFIFIFYMQAEALSSADACRSIIVKAVMPLMRMGDKVHCDAVLLRAGCCALI
jgi:hypothetical protein